MKIIYKKAAIDDLLNTENYIINQFHNDQTAKKLKNNIVENHVFGVEARKAERKYKKSKMNQVDANNDNEKNDEIIHAEEEEEDYEDIIIPKTKRIK